MPDKKFYVQIPGTTQGMSVSAEDFEAKKDKLFNTYKDAVAVEMQDYTNGEDVGDSDFVVTIPGTTEPMQINAADFAKKKDKLFEQYPDAKVTRVRGVNYWGNKLQEGEDRIKALEEELKGIPEDVPLSEDPRAIQGGSIVGMQKLMVEKQRREAPNRARRGEIKQEIEQIKRDREENPAWQQYWQQQGKENDEARARIGQLQKRHTDIMNEHSFDSALAAGDDDYLRIADRFYQDAKKMIDAPSKYADDNQGALGDFWQGIKDTGWNAVSLVDLAHKLHEIPFLETVKKIQKSEGNNANVYDLIKNHPERLYEMGMGDAEVEMLKAFVHKADVESGKSDLLTKSYQAGQSMAKSLGFMADFIALGGIGDAAAEAVAGGLVKQAGRRAVPKLAAESFGGLVKAAAMTPLMPSTYANFIGNLEQFNDAGGIDLSGKAMLKDVGDILIENVSETIGAKPLELIGMPLQKVKFPAWAKAMRNSPIAGALKQAGYNGFFEEMFEEWTGSALRTMTGVDKDALKDFWQVDQILVTAGSFAPVALLGGSVSAAQFHTASKSMRDKGAVIDGIIGGLQDENAKNAIKDSFDKTRDIETPEDLAHAMTDVYQQIVQNGGNEEQAFKAVMDYTEAASRYKVMNGMFEEQKDIERSQKLAEMDQQMGNTKWHHLGKNGSSYVRTITDDQGNERFVTGEDDTNLLVVDKEGKPNFISKESLATGVENGTLTDSGEQYLFDYIDKQNLAVKQEEEQVRMVDEKKAAHEEVMRRALPDTPVNPEKPEEGTFRGIVGGRYVIQYPDGTTQDFSEEEIANKLGIRTVPETDAEIEAKDDAHEEKLENLHTAMNQFKGHHIVLPGIADMGYTLTGVVRNRNSESYPFSVFFRDADRHESGTGVSEEDMDALLAEMQAEQPEVQVPDVEPEVEVADNIPRDFRGNPLPMRQNEQTGETVVDEDALRENDIEAWVRYNDANPNRVVSSRDWLAFNIKKTASEVTKAADEITNAELNGVPARQKDAMKKALADKEKLLQSYESAMQRLTTPEDVIGDMPSYIADEQQPETQETAAPSMRDFRGNPIPMADESEVDETAFFQQDPEAWMEWNNAQMNDGGEDSRNYVKGEIGRENKNIARLQKEYNGEKDFKKRKELRKKIQDAQQRIADLEQAVENVEKRMQRRSARELEPQSVDEVISLGIANFKGSIDRDELKRETGMSDADLQGFVGGFVKEGGMSIGQLAEAIKTADDTHLTDSISDDELRSDILEFLRGSTKWSDITNYIANKRAVQKAEEERQVQEAIAAGATEETDENSIIAVLRAIAQKGKEYARSIFGQRFFDVVETPSFLKDLGLTGQRFTISYGVIARHVGKDSSHDLTEEEWNQLPEAIQHPFAVSEYYPEGIESGKQRGYRIYTTIKKGNGYIVVGVDVKSMGRDMEINSISTVFSKDTRAGEKERFIYKVQNLTPEQEALLNEPNSQTYLPEQEQVSEVESVPTIGNGSSTNAVEVNRGNTEGATTTSGDSSTTSENKDSEISETQAKISEEEAKVDTEPTEAQKEAGNYRKGHIKLDGYNISIEQPKGSIRSGIDEQGNPWSVTMNNTYGYIRGTEGVDGDHIDVFLSDNPEEGDIFVVDQIKPDGSFDEHKVMFGFPDMEAARKAYLSNYSEGWQGLGAITAVSREEFKKWVESSHRKTKPFSEYKSVKAEGEQHEEPATPVEAEKNLAHPANLREAYESGDAERIAEAEKAVTDYLNASESVAMLKYTEAVEKRRRRGAEKEFADYRTHDFILKVISNRLKELDKTLPKVNGMSAVKAFEAAEKTYGERFYATEEDLNRAVEYFESELAAAQQALDESGIDPAQKTEDMAIKALKNRVSSAKTRIEGLKMELGRFREQNEADAEEESSEETLTEAQKESLAFVQGKTTEQVETEFEAKQKAEKEAKRQRKLVKRAEKWKKLIGEAFDLLSSEEDVMAMEESEQNKASALKEVRNGAHGWYSESSDKAYIYLPNIRNTHQLDQKILHEVLTHKGLRHLLGREGYDRFLDRVWDNMSEEARKWALDYYKGNSFPSETARQRAGADEYLAKVAEGNETVAAVFVDNGFWSRAARWLKELINDMIGEDFFDTSVSHTWLGNELMKSYLNLQRESRAKDEQREEPLTEAQKKSLAFVQGKTAGQVEAEHKGRKIEDWGEKIAGARKDRLSEIARTLDNATEESFAALPLAKAFKRPNTKKLIEEGLISQDEAAFIDAVSMLVLGNPKPREKKRKWSYERELKAWSKEQARLANMLRSYLNADDNGRAAIIESLAEIPKEQKVAADAYRKQLIEWNRHLKPEEVVGNLYTPRPEYVAWRVLREAGFIPGSEGKVKIPSIQTSNGRYFTVEVGHAQIPAYSLDEAIDKAVYLTRVQMGDSDIQHPLNIFSAVATEYRTEPAGEYFVDYDKKRGFGFERKDFGTDKAAAEKFVNEHKEQHPALHEYQRRVPIKWEARVKHPITGEFTNTGFTFDSREEFRQSIEAEYEKYNDKANEAFSSQAQVKKEKKSPVYVAAYYDRNSRSMQYGVFYEKGKGPFATDTLADGFKNKADAEKWLADNREGIDKMLSDVAKKRKEFTFFKDGVAERKGTDRRGGRDITGEDLGTTFGFRGIQYGNYANDRDRQAALNQAYDSFWDLAELLGLSPKALSLNGTLGLSFGARGSGWANAHYESAEVVINLTKTRGAGSLAHEWWHAVCNYFARQENVPLGDITEMKPTAMRPELAAVFNNLKKAIDASDYAKRSRGKGADYWGSMPEMTARLFAEWAHMKLSDAGQRNDFLTRGVDQDLIKLYQRLNYRFYEWGLERRGKTEEKMSEEEFAKTPQSLTGMPEPTLDETRQLGPLMQSIFDTMEEQTNEETGKTMLFSKKKASEEESDMLLFSFLGEKGAARLDERFPLGKRMKEIEIPSKNVIKRFLGKKETKQIEEAVTRVGELETAKKMLDSGKDAAAIKLATGWERGKDGRWRYEESDLSLNPAFFDENQGRKRDELKIMRWPISEVLAHDEAYETLMTAYPELADIKVSLYNDALFDIFDANRGYYDDKRKLMMLNPNEAGLFGGKSDLDDLRSVLVHEVQHIIQDKEGFARGGNTHMVSKYGMIPAIEKQRDDLLMAKEDIIDRDPEMRSLKEERDRLMEPGGEYAEWSKRLEAARDMREWNEIYDKQPEYQTVGTEEELSDIRDRIWERRKAILENDEEVKAILERDRKLGEKEQEERYRLYQAIAGEVEARNAQARMGFTADQRKNSTAESTEDVPRDEQIVMGRKRGVGFLSVPINARLAAIEQGQQFSSIDGNVTIKTGFFKSNGKPMYYELSVPKTKAKGGKFFLDEDLLSLLHGGEFSTRGGKMQATIWPDNLKAVLNKLAQKGVRVSENGSSVHNREADQGAPRLDVSNPFQLAGAVASVNRMAKRLGLDVRFDNKMDAKGAYTEGTDYVRINLANCESIDDAVETLLHEGVAHFGLRKMLGDQGMKDFIADVLSKATPGIRRKIENMAAENGWSLEYAAEEYIAELAEKTDYTRQERSFWRDVVQAIRNFIDLITGRKNRISDETIREMLRASYENLEGGGETREVLRQGIDESDKEFARRCIVELEMRYHHLVRYVEVLHGVKGDPDGVFLPEDNIIRIFAHPKTRYSDYEGTYFHENLHAFLAQNGLDGKSPLVMDQIQAWRSIAPDIIDSAREQFIKLGYDENEVDEELFVGYNEAFMSFGLSDFMLDNATQEAKDIIERYYQTIGYEAEKETATRNGSYVREYFELYNVPSGQGLRNTEGATRVQEEVEGAAGTAAREPGGITHYSLRTKPAPEKTGIGYKVFFQKEGKLYPPMVANPGGEATPVGVWLDADAAPVAGQSKTGRPQVKAGGKGTQGGSGRLAYRPGWHLGEIPYAIQFNRINPETGRKELFPRDFVWAEVEYAADNDYQQEAEAEGTNASGNYQHSLAGLKRVPEDGFYRYRTNPNPETDPWIITGAMKVNRILTDEEVDELVRAAGREPQQRESDIVRNRIAETSDSRKIAGILYDRYENQNGEDKPWMSEEDLFERVESELPYDRETKPLFALIDEYRRLSDEDFEEGRRDFSGGEMSDLFNNFLSALKSYSEDTQVRNRIAGVEVFISNAEAAVNAIKQEKATPEQWLKMIEKNGGLKAGEDKWLGLSDWLKSQNKKTLTKQEVSDFIGQNKIQIEEVQYSEGGDIEAVRKQYPDLDEAFHYDESDFSGVPIAEIWDLDKALELYNEAHPNDRITKDEAFGDITRLEREKITAWGEELLSEGNPINPTRLRYTTEGLDNNREIALTVPTVEPWNESDEIHFGDAGRGRAVAWVRFGDARTEDGGKVLFIDEIQSKRHQEGREKGYQRSLTEVEQTEIDQANKKYHEALQAYHEADQRLLDALQPYKDQVFEGRISGQQYSDAINTDPEIGRLNRERSDARDLADKYRDRRDAVERRLARTGVPPAPFEKNWHELAMKRMLRLAAEEGYDYVAWTTGEQQAERYNIGNYVSSIDRTESDEGTRDFGFYFGDSEDSTWVQTNDDGIIIDGEQRTVGELKGKPLSALVGKEVAVKMMQMKVDDVIEDVNTIVGGEGMKGFYDDILPRFMNKYGKQWGVKVSDETVRLSNNTNILTHMVPVTQEMKDSVMEGQLMFREGKTQSPVQYSESLSGKREAVNRVAELCGVEIEFKPSSEMRFKGKPLAGRWINGRMQICLEHCRDEADAVRTVLHEGVGHNGLRRLIGNENMREFCLELFKRLPEQARKQIADAAVNKYGLNIAEAVEEYLAEQAEIMDFENEDYSRSFWNIVRDALRKVLTKIGINVSLSERDVRWLMWQSYNANKQRDPLNEVKRQVVANKLGFTLTQQADKMEGIQIARNRVALEDELDAATDAYNEAAASLWNRMKETFVDQYQSVGKLVSAIEDATGKKASSFEDIRLALNRHSSKALATMQQWIGKYNTPMWDAIKELREKIGGTVNDVSRYVMLKHGLERNEVFAKRDAREYYQGIRDRAVNEIKATKDLSKDEKDQRIAKEDDRLEKHLKAIEAGTNAKYREFRQRDYGGLTSFYSEFDKVDPQRPGEGKERYNARLQKARHPKYTTVDENGRMVVDMAATEKAAADEVAAFERQSEGLTDKLWQRINAATKATLEHQYQSNMLGRKQYEQVRDMFKYYVPLRGFEDDTAQDLYSYYNEDQRGNFEKPLIRATGRKTRAESPFGHIGAMASSGIAADMKNETKLSLYYFVSNRPNDLVTISDVWYEKTGETDEDGREVFKAVYPSFSEDLSSEEAKNAFDDWEDGMKEKAKSGLAFKGRKNLDLHNAVIHIDKGQKTEHVVKFKVGGRDMMMYINGNPRAAQAINGELNYNAENNFFVRAFNAVLRTMAALNTALNPEFWISNFQRDALFSLMSVDVKEGSKYRDAFAKNLVSGKTIFKMKKAFDEGTLGDLKDEQLFREFAENGGITGYTVVYDNEYWEKKLDEYAGKDRNVVARFNDFFKSISDFGEAVEIRTRFAAYKTSREMGKDIIGSVNDAKELTVNFNRKGSGKAITLDEAAKLTGRNGKPLSKPWQLVASMFSSISPLGRRMIMFFNAAVQGLNAMIKLYKNNPRRMAVWSAGYLAVGMINAVLHSMLDDDDDYLDIPDWERRNNLLLGGKGAYLKWALPQEARVFYALGDMVVNHALGREPHKNLAFELLESVGEALPIDVASGVGAFLPSAAMPIIDIVRNKDYKGAKVHNDRRFYSEEERKDIPKWRDPLANTVGLYVGLAKVISRITGGDEYGAGWWNPDPNDIEHLVEGYTGGLGTTVEKMLQFFGDIYRGEFVVRDTPFLRRILSLNDERYRNTHTTELYYYYTNRAKDTKRQIREARKNGDSDKLDELYDSDDFEIMNICESYDSLLKWYSDELKFTDDKQDRKAIMHEQDAVRKEMIQEISNIGK